MTRAGFRPSIKLLKHLGTLCVFSLLMPALAIYFDTLELRFVPIVVAVVIALIIAIDWFRSRSVPNISIRRTMPTNLSVNVEQKIRLDLINDSDEHYDFELTEHLPSFWQTSSLPLEQNLVPGETVEVFYFTTPKKRGAASIQVTELRVVSILGYWQFSWRHEQVTDVKVYPNFTAITDMAGLNGSVNLEQAGLKKFNLRGSGMDFRQLREYREGESLKQIDWCATSRFNKLISKEFQEERNQHVIIMLDAGRRMRVHDDALSYFDHALNSLILLSHTALKNGDNLSLQSFGSEARWLGQMKGVQSVGRVLHHFYDLYPEKIASDYLQAAQDLLQRQPKRALILLVSCLRDEDFSDLLNAVKLLQKKHLVAVISIAEPVYQSVSDTDNHTFEQALMFGSAQTLHQSIEKNFQKLRKQGVICLNTPSQELTSNVINTYLSVKRAGLL